MDGRRIFRTLAVSIAGLAGAIQAQAPQTPTINAPNGTPPGLQAVAPNGTPAAVTGGLSIPGGFTLAINGNFTPGFFHDVNWLNTVTSQTQTFVFGAGVFSITATQILVTIPQNLFATAVASAQPVTVTVTESPLTNFHPTSASATFTINPLGCGYFRTTAKYS